MTARNEAALAAAQARLVAAGGGRRDRRRRHRRSLTAAERIADAATRRFGRIDTWVNNAAAATVGRVADTAIADQRRGFDVGYWGTVYGSLAALKRLRETKAARSSTSAASNQTAR